MVSNFKEKNFWLTFFITISVLAIALAVFFAVRHNEEMQKIKSNVISNENVYKRRVENSYRQTLYTIEDSLKNLDADLAKTALSNDEAMQSERLLNVVSQANNLTANIARLPVESSENLGKIESFANQTADLAVSMIKRLVQGEKLSAKDKATLISLDGACSSLYHSVKEFADRQQNALLVDKLFADGSGAMSELVNGIDNQVFEYEKLIYDGPYSDSTKKATLNCKGNLSINDGEKIVKEKFLATSVNFVGKVQNNGVTYVYDMQNKDGKGQVALACDGRLVEYEFVPNQDCKYTIDSNQASAVAQKFCRQHGFDVQPVWVSALADDVIYVNLAHILDGAVVYCDLVKVAVSCNGLVVGAETRAYLSNYHSHDVSFGKLSQKEATNALDVNLKVANVRKAIVNKLGKDYACWEVEGSFDGNQYFVYVDSNTGKEVEIFKVIQGTEGHTVM